MGYSTFYQAISQKAKLFERLRKDRKIYLLFHQWVFPYSCDIFNASEVFKLDLDNNLDGIVEEGIVTSRVVAEKLWNEFLTYLEAAKSLYPAMADRSARLERNGQPLGTALMLEIECMKLKIDKTLDDYVYQFLRGSEPLTANLSYYSQDELYLVPSSLVKKLAEILRQIELREMFEKHRLGLYYYEDFERWKNLYLEASGHDEALLVKVV